MYGIKSVVAAVTVATMVGSSAFAADGAFTSGKPAGVRPAQAMNIGNGTLYIGLAAAAVITAVAITVSNQNGNNSPAGALGTGNTQGVTPATST
jgi:hypothetical protein